MSKSAPLGYLTTCGHVWSGFPGVCVHGRETGTTHFPPNAEYFHSRPLEGPVVSTSKEQNENE